MFFIKRSNFWKERIYKYFASKEGNIGELNCVVLYCLGVLALLYCIVLCYIVLYWTVLFCTVLYLVVVSSYYLTIAKGRGLGCIVLCCIVLCCIVLYCIILNCTVLYSTAPGGGVLLLFNNVDDNYKSTKRDHPFFFNWAQSWCCCFVFIVSITCQEKIKHINLQLFYLKKNNKFTISLCFSS